MTLKLKKSKARFAVGVDAIAGGTSEADAIRAINRAKGFSGNDTVQTQSDTTPASVPSTVAGNDSVEVETPAAEQPVVEPPAVQPVADAQPQMISLKPEELKQLVGDAIAAAVAPITSQLQAANQEAQAAKQERDRLAGVFQVMGNPNPGNSNDRSANFPAVNTRVPANSDKIPGAAAEYDQILNDSTSTPARVWINPYSGRRHVQRDYAQLKSFWKQNKDSVRADMETAMKRQGFLMGWKAADYAGSDASTQTSNVPDLFLNYLSMVVRENHSPKYIYWQFANHKLELGKGPGLNILVPRFPYMAEPTSGSDFTLTPGTRIDSTGQAITESAVSITLKEHGLGKDAQRTPYIIPEFISAYSLMSLENVMQRNLGHNYMGFQDVSLRSLWAATTRVVYNKKGAVVTSPTAIAAAGDDGTLIENFLNNLYAYMCAQQIPTYMNGCYGLSLHSNALAQFKNSLASKESFSNSSSSEEVTNILNASTNGEMGKVSGYVGTYCNFMIFTTNAHSLGNPGSEGVQTETLGGSLGTATTRTSYAFGADTIAEAIGMEMEIRRNNNDDYQRSNEYIWLAHSGYGHLDVDPAINASQQLRVVQIRTLDQPV